MRLSFTFIFALICIQALTQESFHTLFEPKNIQGSFYYQSQEITSYGDVNGDGFTDIITKNQLYLFDGHKFSISTNFPLSTSELTDIVNSNSLLIDIDFDSDLDLIFTQNAAQASADFTGLYLNQNGEFTKGENAILSFLGSQSYQLLKFDFNKDEKEDIIAIGQADSYILLQKDNDWEKIFVEGLGAPISSRLTSYDLDNDGDLDLISSNGDVIALFNNGSSIESQALDFPHGSKYLLADFNKDGQFEVCTIKQGQVVIHRYLDGSWIEDQRVSVGQYITAYDIDDFQLSDIDQDGQVEIISALRLGTVWDVPKTELQVKSIDSEFNEITLSRHEANAYFNSIDLNNDGYEEVISIDRSDNLDFQNYSSTLIFKNTNGALSRAFGFGFHDFMYTQEYNPDYPAFRTSISSKLIGDFNNDNQPDFISVKGKQINIYLSNNNFEFHDPTSLQTGSIMYLSVDHSKINTLQLEDSKLKLIQYELIEGNLQKSINLDIPTTIADIEINSLLFNSVDLYADNTTDYIVSINTPGEGGGQVSDVGESFTVRWVDNEYKVYKNNIPLANQVLEADLSGDGKNDLYFGFSGPNQDGWNNKFKYFLLLKDNGTYDTLINNDQSIPNGGASMHLENEAKDILILGGYPYSLQNGALVKIDTDLDLSWSYSSTPIDFDLDGDSDRIQYQKPYTYGQPFPPLAKLSFIFWWNVNGVYIKDERETSEITVGNDPSTFLELTSDSNKIIFFKRRGLHQFVSQDEPSSAGVVTSTNEEYEANSIQVYPNPVFEKINIRLEYSHSPISWRIINSNGATISSGTVNKNEFEIDTSSLSSGIFILKLEGKGVKKSIKFIKDLK